MTVDGKTYAAEGTAPGTFRRKMDCMDCHNRAGHDFQTAEAAVDQAISIGRLDRSKPFTPRDAVAALQGKLPIGQQPMVVQQIYLANVFPGMKIVWGTYPNNIGHMAFPGCFRCHAGQHATKGGDTITQDCSVCHEPMAVDEQNPAILKTLGMEQGKGT